MKVVITGVSKGLGKNLFDLLSVENIEIIAISRKFCDYQIELAENNKNIELLQLDLSNLKEVKNHLTNITNEEIIFINNAATIEPICNIEEMKSDDIINTLNINFVSPILLINNLSNNKLLILNISTGAANHPIDKWSLYCSSKAGLKMFLDVILLQNNYEIINIDPGVMNTEMQETIRTSNFANVNYFKDLQENNLLKDPNAVAMDIFNKYIKGKI